MNELRPFKLVFSFEAPGHSQKEALRKLEGTLDAVSARGLLDFLDSPPTIRSAEFLQQGWGRDGSFANLD